MISSALTVFHTDPSYARLKTFLIASTGLVYYADRDHELAAILDRRFAEAGCDNCGSYLDLLHDRTQAVPELDAIVERLTVGETYFFRHIELFEALKQSILPEIIARNGFRRQLRIWSAGCANGAEAYSVALILARDFGHLLGDWDVQILGTDINRSALGEARRGRFAEWSLRSTPAEVRTACFSHDSQGWTIRPEHKRWIDFQYHNLAERPFQSPLADVDVILCRNVTIYFSPEETRAIIHHFHESLSEEGWLLVGHAEPNLESFGCFRTFNAPGATCYQKSSLPARQEEIPREIPAWPQMPPYGTGATENKAHVFPVPLKRENRIEPSELAAMRLLANRGDAASTLSSCQALLHKDKSNPLVYFYRALAFDITGAHREAEQSLRQAIYLDRKFVFAHYHLGLARKKERNHRGAAQSFENVLRLLSAVPDEQPFAEGDGMTAGELRQLAETHLKILGGSGKEICTPNKSANG